MPKLASIAVFVTIAASSLARAGTVAADKVMAAALERAAEQRASQAADMAEAIADRVTDDNRGDGARIKAASGDKIAACRQADVAQSAREIADQYYYLLNGKAAGGASRAYRSVVRADAACKRTLNKYDKVARRILTRPGHY